MPAFSQADLDYLWSQLLGPQTADPGRGMSEFGRTVSNIDQISQAKGTDPGVVRQQLRSWRQGAQRRHQILDQLQAMGYSLEDLGYADAPDAGATAFRNAEFAAQNGFRPNNWTYDWQKGTKRNLVTSDVNGRNREFAISPEEFQQYQQAQQLQQMGYKTYGEQLAYKQALQEGRQPPPPGQGGRPNYTVQQLVQQLGGPRTGGPDPRAGAAGAGGGPGGSFSSLAGGGGGGGGSFGNVAGGLPNNITDALAESMRNDALQQRIGLQRQLEGHAMGKPIYDYLLNEVYGPILGAEFNSGAGAASQFGNSLWGPGQGSTPASGGASSVPVDQQVQRRDGESLWDWTRRVGQIQGEVYDDFARGELPNWSDNVTDPQKWYQRGELAPPTRALGESYDNWGGQGFAPGERNPQTGARPTSSADTIRGAVSAAKEAVSSQPYSIAQLSPTGGAGPSSGPSATTSVPQPIIFGAAAGNITYDPRTGTYSPTGSSGGTNPYSPMQPTTGSTPAPYEVAPQLQEMEQIRQSWGLAPGQAFPEGQSWGMRPPTQQQGGGAGGGMAPIPGMPSGGLPSGSYTQRGVTSMNPNMNNTWAKFLAPTYGKVSELTDQQLNEIRSSLPRGGEQDKSISDAIQNKYSTIAQGWQNLVPQALSGISQIGQEMYFQQPNPYQGGLATGQAERESIRNYGMGLQNLAAQKSIARSGASASALGTLGNALGSLGAAALGK